MLFKIIGCVFFGGFALYQIITIINDIKNKNVVKVDEKPLNNK